MTGPIVYGAVSVALLVAFCASAAGQEERTSTAEGRQIGADATVQQYSAIGVPTSDGDLVDEEGTIVRLSRTAEWYVIVPDANKSTRFAPSNLPDAFKVHGLRIVFSGRIGKIEPNERLIGVPFDLTNIRAIEPASRRSAVCPPAPDPSCEAAFGRGLFFVDEAIPGGEKMVVKWMRGPALLGTDFGNPLRAGGTAYSICVYDDAGSLAGRYTVARAGQMCGTRPCWKPLGAPPGDSDHKGQRYRDRNLGADGIVRMLLKASATGESKALVKGRNRGSMGRRMLPSGVATALRGSTSATVQLLGSDARTCISVDLPVVTKARRGRFKARK